MRLRRIEAVRFGGLQNVSLGDLGDRLTVVRGPNEAGKSSFTALVRHVLYRFPDRRQNKRQYLSSSGEREGRLVFEDDDGEWVVERVDGVRGGSASIRTVRGPDRPALLEEVRRGVSEEAFEVVFGFGLSEMSAIETARGKEDDVISLLYAAGAGLPVSPAKVRAGILTEAGSIWAPNAQKPRVNEILASVKQKRGELRGLQLRAEAFKTDVERLRELDEAVAASGRRRDDARGKSASLSEAEGRFRDLRRAAASAADTQKRLRLEIEELEPDITGLRVDREVLAAGDSLDVPLRRSSAIEQTIKEIAEHRSRLDALTREIAEVVGRIGSAEEQVLAANTTDATRAMLDQRQDNLRALQVKADDAGQRAAKSRNSADAFGTEVLRTRESGGGGRPVTAALVMLAIGLAAVLAGVALREYVAAVIGVLVLAAGGFFLLRGGAADILRGADADEVRLEDRARAARVQAEQDASDADDARRLLAEARSEWRDWLEAQGIPVGGEEPTAVAATFGLLVRAKGLASELEVLRETIDEASRRVAAYSAELAAVAGNAMPKLGSELQDVVSAADQIREKLAAARAAAKARDGLELQRDFLRRQESDAERARDDAIRSSLEVLAAIDLPPDTSEQDLASLASLASEETVAAQNGLDELADERSRLKGKLDSQGREDEDARLRLELTGLRERLVEAVGEYVTLGVASRVLERAQRRYEDERQPVVVQRAQQALRSITGHRYVRLRVPGGEEPIEVFDAASAAKTTDKLSGGTADQLYLALRLGLLEQLGEAGAGLPVLMDDILVNFDPERALGAARAIADLSRSRQVVLFTCHPATVEMFREVEPDLTLVELLGC